jgi:hypothetical protein
MIPRHWLKLYRVVSAEQQAGKALIVGEKRTAGKCIARQSTVLYSSSTALGI